MVNSASPIAATEVTAPPANEVWITKKQIEQTGIATTEVGDREVGNVMTTTGRIAFSDSRVAHVFSPVTGRVTQIIGSTFDVEFPEESLPAIYNALKINSEHKGIKISLTGEVQQH